MIKVIIIGSCLVTLSPLFLHLSRVGHHSVSKGCLPSFCSSVCLTCYFCFAITFWVHGVFAGLRAGWGGLMVIGCTEVEEKVLALKKVILETGYIVYNK